jgi:tetratricopeptide (TPR) repeat protein
MVDVVGTRGITLLVEPAFLLKASEPGLKQVQRVWENKGWALPSADAPSKAALPPIAVLQPDTQSSLSEEVATETWKRFIQGKPIYVATFKICCEILNLNWQDVVEHSNRQVRELPVRSAQLGSALPSQTQTAIDSDSSSNSSFVGRSGAIASLNHLVKVGANAIMILGTGGLGKTTLARQYFAQEGFNLVLECWMAKETANIVPAESIVQEWLQRHFGEESARDFRASLERLRQKLQQRSINGLPTKIGVLIDNLEPALDRQGRLIEAHRGYAALLKVLADPTVQSVTLITSREPLHEPSVSMQSYILPGLDEKAWRQFFSSRRIQPSAALKSLHRAYGGNAKAMTLLSSIISVDYGSNLDAFWQDNQTDLLMDADLESLVSSYFDRLQQLYPEAYRLLCRLGCYRYQDVATVPPEGLHALLWDVSEAEHHRIVRFLRELFLIEECTGRYRLHPVVQAKAIALLKSSQSEWTLANCKAAEFWTQQVTAVETIEDALTALEAYCHYSQIGDVESAAQVILHQRDNQWEKSEPLGVSFYRLGLLQRMIAAIAQIIQSVKPGYSLSMLYRILGDLYWLSGRIHHAISCHQKARDVAIAFQLKELDVVSLFNIGLCKIELGEMNDALTLFNQVNALADRADCHMYAVGSWFCLAFLYSCLGAKPEAIYFVNKVSKEYAVLSASSWSRGYSLLFLGSTLKNLGEMEQAQTMYYLAQEYAEQSFYTQVKARALNGMAQICRERQDFKGAIANHQAARQLLDRIEARADLAEVYYQLGLTQQQMNQLSESQLSLNAARQLFQQMGAPKQVEKVNQALSN